MLNKRLYEITHPHYCSASNHFRNEYAWEYESWEEFYEEHKDADVGMNLIFRCDWSEVENQDEPGEIQQLLQLSVIRQRKGIYGVYLIYVNKEDEPNIRGFLTPYAEYMKNLWSAYQ